MTILFRTGNLIAERIFTFVLAVGLWGLSSLIPASGQQKNWSPQECQWLEGYVKDSSLGGTFPLGLTTLTWAVGSPPDALPAQREEHKIFIEDAVEGFGLPVSFVDDQDSAQVFIYFHTKQETKDDIDRILAELRSVPRVSISYPEGYPLLYDYSYNQCSFSYIPTADNPVSKINIQIPFDRKTGLPIDDAKRCVVEGLVKTFGISLQDMGTGRTGWTVGCPRCLETDLRMAEIILKNNKTVKEAMTVSRMLKELVGGSCSKS